MPHEKGEKSIDRFLKRLKKLHSVSLANGLVSNEAMINRCSYRKIQRGPKKAQSLVQKAYDQKLFDLLMQEEKI